MHWSVAAAELHAKRKYSHTHAGKYSPIDAGDGSLGKQLHRWVSPCGTAERIDFSAVRVVFTIQLMHVAVVQTFFPPSTLEILAPTLGTCQRISAW